MAPKALQRRLTGRSSSQRAVLWIRIEERPRPLKLETSGLGDVDSLISGAAVGHGSI